MEFVRTYAAVALLMVLLDLPWLLGAGPWAVDMLRTVQGGLPVRFDWRAAIPVYLATAFLVTRARSTLEAFWIGLSTYAVYDFTNLATLSKYDPKFAVADSLWGGTLFALTREAARALSIL